MGHHVDRPRHRRQRHVGEAAGILVLQAREQLDGNARLPGATGAGNGQHTHPGTHEITGLRQRVVAAQQRGGRRRCGSGDPRCDRHIAGWGMTSAGARERPPPLLDRGKAIGWRLRQRAFDRLAYWPRHRGAHGAQWSDRLDRVPYRHGDCRGAGERWGTGQHLVHHTPQRVQIAACVTHDAAGQLRTHVGGRAHRHRGYRARCVTRGVHGVREAEVGHDRLAVLDENVLRRDIVMHHAASMRVAQCVRDLISEAEGIGDRQRPVAREPVAQALALHHGRYGEEVSRRVAGVVQRHEVGVAQPHRGGDRAQEAIGRQRCREGGAQHLHRHRAVVSEVFREVHGGHAVGAELSRQAVAVGQR